MNFYFDAAGIIDRLDARQGSVKSLLSTLSEKNRKRTAALVIETLKCGRTPQQSNASGQLTSCLSQTNPSLRK